MTSSPVIADTGFWVALDGQIGAGRSIDELLTDYPHLEREDILQALRYAAWRAQEREVPLAAE